MEKKIQIRKDAKGLQMLKALLFAYVVTGILLLILALMLHQFHLKESQVNIGIIVIYVLSTFAGGFVLGKMMRVRKFFWGLILGVLYFALLLLVSLGVYKSLQGNGTQLMTTLILCAGGGMLGGMIS